MQGYSPNQSPYPQNYSPQGHPRANTTLINHILGLNIKYSRVIQIHRIAAVMAATVVITLVVRTVVSLAKVRATHLLQPARARWTFQQLILDSCHRKERRPSYH